MESEIVLKTDRLSIGYQTRQRGFSNILENINLTCYQSELIALIGENGSGKSTLLKTLSRLFPFNSGEILFRNKLELVDIINFSRKDFAKKLSFVSTEIIKVENLRVFDVVALGRFPYTNWFGSLSEIDIEIINHSIDLVGLNHFKDKNINEISDGERQKVLIARSLAQDTEIIILDEPTAFLDLPNRYELICLLGILAKEKRKTIVFSTHDLNLALKEADKIWLMLDKDILEGAPEDLILNETFNHIFENSSLNFDKLKGDFRIKRKHDIKIGLTGDGIYYTWTKKALERMNFSVEKGNESIHFITLELVNESCVWKYTNQIESVVFNTIYDLSKYLKFQVRI